MSVVENTAHWWQKEVIYEIYLRSFKDSNGDGIGDIQGVIEKLDYLQWLGTKAIWITPFYPSPMKDFGYDISDYRAVDPLFGTIDQLNQLINEIHRRDMKLIIDLVPNHTSDQHQWFKESASSRDNPKRDWYIWKDPKPGGDPPNNWISVLGGSAWEWHEPTGQFYYHAFLKEQPDLNLRNHETVKAILEVMRFWLDKGVDGFRVDVMWHLIKDEYLRDNPVNDAYKTGMPDSEKLLQVFSCDQPEVHGIIKQMRNLTDEYKERAIVGELYLAGEKVINYYGEDCDGAHLPSNFELLFMVPWKADKIALAVDKFEAALPNKCWPNWVLGNHDKSRLFARIGEAQLKVAAVLLLTLRGTPTIYYGEEIGMRQAVIPEDEIQDPQGILMPGKNLSRDGQRTPMQWDTSANAGFSTSKPWMRLGPAHEQVNVAIQQEDDFSVLNFYRKVIQLRQSEPALSTGLHRTLHSDQSLFAFQRTADGSDSFIIVLNFSHSDAALKLKEPVAGTIVLSASGKLEGELFKGEMVINADDALIIRIKK